MSNFAQDIEVAAAGDVIEAVVIGGFGWGSMDDEPGTAYGENRIERKAPVKRGVILTWDEARPMLDYDYSTGYGSPECDAIMVWTTDQILFVVQYDGATGIEAMPRNPVAMAPVMPGG